jgi:hypothetical protein
MTEREQGLRREQAGKQAVKLAKDWVQPKQRFDPKKDYNTLPRFMPDYGRADAQAYWAQPQKPVRPR